MKTKLIKLSENHYIIVDDSEIKEGDWYIDDTNTVRQSITSDKDYWSVRQDYKKITHSTQPLERYYGATDGTIPFVYHKIKPLPLSEIEESIYGYSVKKMAEKEIPYQPYDSTLYQGYRKYQLKGYLEGFKAHQELVKDKLFTVEQAYLIWKAGQEYWKTSGSSITFEELIERKKELLLPKTEWDVEFDENNKLKLI